MADHIDVIARSFALPLTLGIGAAWHTLRTKEGRERITSALKAAVDFLATSSFLDKVGSLMKWGFAVFLVFGLYHSIRRGGWEAGRDYQARVCFQAPASAQCLRNAPYDEEEGQDGE